MENRLYRKFPAHPLSNQDSDWKLCVPTAERQEVLYDNHDATTAGHLGIAKTASRIMKLYYWPGMYRDIAKYVSKCRVCRAFKVSQQKQKKKRGYKMRHRAWKPGIGEPKRELDRLKHSQPRAQSDKHTFKPPISVRTANAKRITTSSGISTTSPNASLNVVRAYNCPCTSAAAIAAQSTTTAACHIAVACPRSAHSAAAIRTTAAVARPIAAACKTSAYSVSTMRSTATAIIRSPKTQTRRTVTTETPIAAAIRPENVFRAIDKAIAIQATPHVTSTACTGPSTSGFRREGSRLRRGSGM